MTRSRPTLRNCRFLLVALAGTVLLTGCTLEDDLEPEPTATATAVTFGPNDIAVGTLIDQSSTAWEDVDAWQSETRIESPGGGASAAAPSVSSERVILPNERHVLNMNGETVVSEEIATGGMMYMRGTLVTSSIYPDVDAETWISFSPDQAPPDTALAQRVAYLTSPPAYPFASVTEETRSLPAKPAGEIQVDEQVCLVYQFTTTDTDSEGIDYRIAFDEADRPCQLVREGGGVVETTVWSYPPSPEPITPPDEAVQVESFPTAP